MQAESLGDDRDQGRDCQPLGTGEAWLEAARCSIIQIIQIATSSPGRTVDGATLVDGLWLALRVVT